MEGIREERHRPQETSNVPFQALFLYELIDIADPCSTSTPCKQPRDTPIPVPLQPCEKNAFSFSNFWRLN